MMLEEDGKILFFERLGGRESELEFLNNLWGLGTEEK